MTRFWRIVRDLCLIGVGVLAVWSTPPSVAGLGIQSVLAVIWASMLGLGALASLFGVIYKKVGAEIYGCTFVGIGFLIWAIAALMNPEANLTSVQIALVFLSGTAGQGYRIGMVTEGRVIR